MFDHRDYDTEAYTALKWWHTTAALRGFEQYADSRLLQRYREDSHKWHQPFILAYGYWLYAQYTSIGDWEWT